MPSNRNTKKRRRRRRHRGLPLWAVTTIATLVSLLVFMIAATITVTVVLNKISRPEVQQDYYTEEDLRELELQEAIVNAEKNPEEIIYPELDTSTVQWTEIEEEIGQAHELVNILLIGQDARPGETRARSDAMILVTFNKTANTITLTSFMRDLYVQIPGYQDNRINAAYAYGGMELLDETLRQNFGVEVDANVEVDFDGFTDIIDILGGVTVELSNSEANALGLYPGENTLGGKSALTYAQLRSIDSDFNRTERQRKVITALFNALKNAGFSEITGLVNTIFPLVTTDMSNTEILSYASDLFPMLSTASISSVRIPADGAYTQNSIQGMAVIVADMEANRELLKETLEPTDN